MDVPDAAEYARRLRAAREATGLTQEEAAAKIGMSKQSYGSYELGKKVPSVVQMDRFISALKLDREFIYQCRSRHKSQERTR